MEMNEEVSVHDIIRYLKIDLESILKVPIKITLNGLSKQLEFIGAIIFLLKLKRYTYITVTLETFYRPIVTRPTVKAVFGEQSINKRKK